MNLCLYAWMVPSLFGPTMMASEINQGLGIEVDVAVDPELDANRIITIQGLRPLEPSKGLVTNLQKSSLSHIGIYVCVYIYIYTYIHTYIYIYT